MAGLHDVADPGEGALQPERNTGLGDFPEPHQFGADLRGHACGLFVGVGDEQAVPAGEMVAEPAAHRGLLGLLDRTAVDDPAVLAALGQGLLVAFPQAKRSSALAFTHTLQCDSDSAAMQR